MIISVLVLVFFVGLANDDLTTLSKEATEHHACEVPSNNGLYSPLVDSMLDNRADLSHLQLDSHETPDPAISKARGVAV